MKPTLDPETGRFGVDPMERLLSYLLRGVAVLVLAVAISQVVHWIHNRAERAECASLLEVTR